MVKHHPTTSKLSKRIKSSWKILNENNSLADLFEQPPIIAIKQPPNLMSLLVRSRLRRTNNQQGNVPCNKPRCQVCQHMLTGGSLTFNGMTVHPGPYNCDSSNVVYIISCSKCPTVCYVGETNTKFRLRFNNHKHSIRNANPNGFPVAEHFQSNGHTSDDLKFTIALGAFRCSEDRKRHELKLILRLNSHRQGLNRDLSYLSGYSFFK